MPKTPWLDMFDRRMQELHQLEYLKRQTADSQAARAQRQAQWEAEQQNEQQRIKLAQEQAARAEAVQRQNEQLQIANLLGMGGTDVTPKPIDEQALLRGETIPEPEDGDITLGGRQFNLPSPGFAQLQAAVQKAELDRGLRNQEAEDVMGTLEQAGIRNPLILGMEKARIMSGGRYNSNLGVEDYIANAASVLADPDATPTEKQGAKDMIAVFQARASKGSGGGSLTANASTNLQLKAAVGEFRQLVDAEIGNVDPTDKSYRIKMKEGMRKATEALLKKYPQNIALSAIGQYAPPYDRPASTPTGGYFGDIRSLLANPVPSQ